jgi:hypothetical protein
VRQSKYLPQTTGICGWAPELQYCTQYVLCKEKYSIYPGVWKGEQRITVLSKKNIISAGAT